MEKQSDVGVASSDKKQSSAKVEDFTSLQDGGSGDFLPNQTGGLVSIDGQELSSHNQLVRQEGVDNWQKLTEGVLEWDDDKDRPSNSAGYREIVLHNRIENMANGSELIKISPTDKSKSALRPPQSSTLKRAWTVLKVCYIISGPMFIIGLVLLVLGIVGFPPTFDLLPMGIALFGTAGIVLVGSTGLLCLYKMKKIKLYDLQDGKFDEEFSDYGNVAYVI